jgi:hypothetical protein
MVNVLKTYLFRRENHPLRVYTHIKLTTPFPPPPHSPIRGKNQLNIFFLLASFVKNKRRSGWEK